jgi:3-oxoacyl-[acyl-carrier protein] reductase
MNLGLEGRSCIVTGGSRGIGAEVARALAGEGANVAVIARTEGALNQVAGRMRDLGVEAMAIRSDLTAPDGPAEAVAAAIEGLGGVDVLVNAAGASPFGSLDQISDSDWAASFELKVMGYVRCIRAVLPTMRQQHAGRIVNIVGMGGRHATPGYVLGALNAALLHLTKSVADLVAADGITVVAVNPGLTDTERLRAAMDVWAGDEGTDPEAYRSRYAARNIPLGRFATAEEIGRTVALLASEATSYVTGSALQVDGGAARGAF